MENAQQNQNYIKTLEPNFDNVIFLYMYVCMCIHIHGKCKLKYQISKKKYTDIKNTWKPKQKKIKKN